MIKWLLSYIGDQIDTKQFGGQKGNSITHYLIEFINFILYNQDMTNPHAVLTLLVDYSQAFNRCNHKTLITMLSDMGVPRWLLEIVISFLSEREFLVRQKGKTSSKKRLPGGTPQGSRLGLFLFLVLINFAGFEPNTHVNNIGTEITKSHKNRRPISSTHMKYIDDLSLCVALNLKENLVQNPNKDIPRPLSYHERTGHELPQDKNIIQHEFDKLQALSRDHGMVINQNKTKVMLFNPSKKFDFLPQIQTDEGSTIEVIEETKLLGILVRSDMSWKSNTKMLCKKSYSRLWILRNLARLGTSRESLIDVYFKQCRSVLELAAPAWTPGLTKTEINQFERVQKTACAIILGANYQSYKLALKTLNMDTLESRREQISIKFAKKALKSEKFNHWFTNKEDKEPNIKTRSYGTKLKLKPVTFRKMKYKNSPLPYLTDLLNQQK